MSRHPSNARLANAPVAPDLGKINEAKSGAFALIAGETRAFVALPSSRGARVGRGMPGTSKLVVGERHFSPLQGWPANESAVASSRSPNLTGAIRAVHSGPAHPTAVTEQTGKVARTVAPITRCRHPPRLTRWPACNIRDGKIVTRACARNVGACTSGWRLRGTAGPLASV